MRLAFLGTPAMAVPPLRALVDAGHDVALVVTRADAKRGAGRRARRRRRSRRPPLELGLPVTDAVDDVLALDPPAELGVVVAFGRIIKPHVLAALPMVNLHFSLLPRWRGAAPVERAILAGDEVDRRVRHGRRGGPRHRRRLPRAPSVAIGPDETADELRARLVEVGTELLVDALADGPRRRRRRRTGEPTYADEDRPRRAARSTGPGRRSTIHRLVRVGGAWTTHRRQAPQGVAHRASPTTAALELLEVQPEGKGRMSFRDWANGARWQPGDPLGT